MPSQRMCVQLTYWQPPLCAEEAGEAKLQAAALAQCIEAVHFSFGLGSARFLSASGPLRAGYDQRGGRGTPRTATML